MDNNVAIPVEQNEGDAFFTQVKKEEIIELFLFELDNELYAVSVEDVDQIMKIPPVTSVPNAPESILGIFHLRGRVIVALDMLKRMRIKRLSSFVPLYLFVSHKQKNYFAVVVDRVFSVIQIPKHEVTPLTSVIASRINAEFVNGMFMYKEPIKQRKNLDTFLIEPKNLDPEAPPPEISARPVLWLNVSLLLDQKEILELQGRV